MRVVFIGTGEIGVPTLRALQESAHDLVAIVTQPDKPVGRDQRIQAPPIKQAAADLTVPILQPVRIREPQSLDQIRACQPDIIVVVAYGQILPPELLAIPRFGCLNLHASLLPRWRGAAPIQAAIAAGDVETGITVMYMDEGLDTGDILLQRQTVIHPTDTGALLHDRLAEVAPDALLAALDLISQGQAPRTPQDNAQSSYAVKLSRESGRINWSEPANAIERKIRAYDPWPGAFMTIAQKEEKPSKLKIYRAVVVDEHGSPGQVVRADEDGLVIAAGGGALLLQEVQLEGKRRMAAGAFVRGHHIAIAPRG